MADNAWIKPFNNSATGWQYSTSPSGTKYQGLTGGWYSAPGGKILKSAQELAAYDSAQNPSQALASTGDMLNSTRISSSDLGSQYSAPSAFNLPSQVSASALNLPSQVSASGWNPSPIGTQSQSNPMPDFGNAPAPLNFLNQVSPSSSQLGGTLVAQGHGSYGGAPEPYKLADTQSQQVAPISIPSAVSYSNPFAGQLQSAQSTMDKYLASSAPTMSTANAFADPLAASQKRLSSLMDDPNSIQQSAAYKFRVGQGQEALQRQMAAKGMLNSGNRLMELTKYGQDMGSQEYDAQAKRLQDQLGLQTTGYNAGQANNLGQYQADVGAHTARGQTLANLMGTATGAASSAYGTGMQAATAQRGQDISAATASRGQDVDMYGQRMQAETAGRGQDLSWQQAQLQAATTGRGQDISALVAGRGQDVDMYGQRIQAAMTGRGQDINAATAGRGQDISWQEAQLQNATTGRGQDLSALLQGRGQDINWQQSQLQAATAGKGYDVTQRGQDLNYQYQLSNLANKNQPMSYGLSTDTGYFNPGGFGGATNTNPSHANLMAEFNRERQAAYNY